MSFFEWVQNLQNFRWDEADVNRRLDSVMTQVLCRFCRWLDLLSAKTQVL